jgi:hypothetical protein
MMFIEKTSSYQSASRSSSPAPQRITVLSVQTSVEAGEKEGWVNKVLDLYGGKFWASLGIRKRREGAGGALIHLAGEGGYPGQGESIRGLSTLRSVRQDSSRRKKGSGRILIEGTIKENVLSDITVSNGFLRHNLFINGRSRKGRPQDDRRVRRLHPGEDFLIKRLSGGNIQR